MSGTLKQKYCTMKKGNLKFESVDIDSLNADLDDLLNENLTQVP